MTISRTQFRLFGLTLFSLLGMNMTFFTAHADTELARIGSRVITLEEFNKRYEEASRFFPYSPPSKKSVLDDLVKRELGIQEAKKIGIDKEPEMIDRVNGLYYQALVEKKLGKDMAAINITDEETKKYYSSNPEIRTSHVYLALSPTASPEIQKEVESRINEILTKYVQPGKMSFAEIAQKHSEGPNAAVGGDMDYQTRDRLDPTYYKAAMSLKVGQVSGVVKSPYGYHIIKLTAVRSWEDVDKAKLKRMLFEQKRQEQFEKFMSSLRAKSEVTIKADLIK